MTVGPCRRVRAEGARQRDHARPVPDEHRARLGHRHAGAADRDVPAAARRRGARDRRRGPLPRHRRVVVHDGDDSRRSTAARSGACRAEARRAVRAQPEPAGRAHEHGPLWLRAVHRLERTVGEPLESLLHSDDVLRSGHRGSPPAGAYRAARSRGSRGGCCTCSTCRRAATSGASVEQLARVERQLAELTKELTTRRDRAAAGVASDGTEPQPVRARGQGQPRLERSLLRARNGIRYVRGSSKPRVGATPKETVWQRGKAQLWRYRGGPARYSPPLLIVHSLVSRSYILDLRPGNSAIEFLLDAGFDVFMLDWGVPDELDANNSFATYVDEYLPRAVEAVRRETGCREVTMAGYCLGGVIATAVRGGAVRRCGAQPDPDGDAGRLPRDGADGGGAA